MNEYAKTLVIIDKDLTRMAEYKMASAEGTSGREYLLNSEELYCETNIVRNLVFENGIITISKFETRFQQWMKHRIQQAERQREEYMKMKSEKERKEQERRKLAEEKNRIQLLEQEKKELRSRKRKTKYLWNSNWHRGNIMLRIRTGIECADVSIAEELDM